MFGKLNFMACVIFEQQVRTSQTWNPSFPSTQTAKNLTITHALGSELLSFCHDIKK